MYVLNLSEDNRILSVTFEEFSAPGQPLVEELPDGDISNYLYINNEYIYSPIFEIITYPQADKNYSIGDTTTIEGVMYEFTSNTPRGTRIIVNQNAIITTFDDQLKKLKGD